jgi:hypothetical protein
MFLDEEADKLDASSYLVIVEAGKISHQFLLTSVDKLTLELKAKASTIIKLPPCTFLGDIIVKDRYGIQLFDDVAKLESHIRKLFHNLTPLYKSKIAKM